MKRKAYYHKGEIEPMALVVGLVLVFLVWDVKIGPINSRPAPGFEYQIEYQPVRVWEPATIYGPLDLQGGGYVPLENEYRVEPAPHGFESEGGVRYRPVCDPARFSCHNPLYYQ